MSPIFYGGGIVNALLFPLHIEQGIMIGVRIGHDAPWHGNIIYEVTDNEIKIAYIDKSVKIRK